MGGSGCSGLRGVPVEPRVKRSTNARGCSSIPVKTTNTTWTMENSMKHRHRFVWIVVALSVQLCRGFVPPVIVVPQQTSIISKIAAASLSDEVDSLGNNVAVKSLLSKVQQQKLLSQVASSGLLSKAQAAGISLSSLEPLLALAAQNPEILILVEASGPELLPFLPTLVDLTPAALPLLASAVGIPPVALQGAGIAALGAAGLAIVVIPDDTVFHVAIQTITVGLALPAAAAAFVGGAVLGQLKR